MAMTKKEAEAENEAVKGPVTKEERAQQQKARKGEEAEAEDAPEAEEDLEEQPSGKQVQPQSKRSTHLGQQTLSCEPEAAAGQATRATTPKQAQRQQPDNPAEERSNQEQDCHRERGLSGTL